MTLPLVALLLAQTFFTWTDKAGVQHFTDDRSTIPKGAKVSTTTGQDLNVVDGDRDPEPAHPKAVFVPIPNAQAPEESEASRRQRELEWREAFRAARIRVSDLEIEIEAERKVVEEVNGLPITGRLSCAGPSITVRGQVLPGYGVGQGGCWPMQTGFEQSRQNLERNRRLLQRAKDELADLERRASFDSVPLEWRR